MAKTTKRPRKAAAKSKKDKCGIVMPIAAFGEYTADHWKDVKEIIVEAAEKAGFEANIVSYTNESAVIHKTIIQNLYDNEIVVVDVSGKNPNVMFELGMRLAFDKPTIVIKDDITNYSFDTSPLDHLGYPATLHYQSVNSFKDILTNKIQATYEASRSSRYSSFLKNFGEFTVSKLNKKPISETEYLLKAVEELQTEIRSQREPLVIAPTPNPVIDKELLYKYWTLYMGQHGRLVTAKIMGSDFAGFRKYMLKSHPSTYRLYQIGNVLPSDILDAIKYYSLGSHLK